MWWLQGKIGSLTKQNVQWDDLGSATHRAGRAVAGFAACTECTGLEIFPSLCAKIKLWIFWGTKASDLSD